MIEIMQLKSTDIEVIHDSFNRAFEDYVEPFKLSVSQLKHMIERRGYDENISFGAFDNGSLVGFTLNGKGIWMGKKTAYDTGTGIVKAYRKQGLATRIFEESLEILKQEGITQYLLEVVLRNRLSLCNRAERERPAPVVTRKLEHRADAVAAFRRELHSLSPISK